MDHLITYKMTIQCISLILKCCLNLIKVTCYSPQKNNNCLESLLLQLVKTYIIKYSRMLYHYIYHWKWNFPMTLSGRLSVDWLVGQSGKWATNRGRRRKKNLPTHRQFFTTFCWGIFFCWCGKIIYQFQNLSNYPSKIIECTESQLDSLSLTTLQGVQ